MGEREKRYQAARRKDDTDGSVAVQAFTAALPGWKREVAEQFDEIIQDEVPQVRRAVKYHQPFYGVEDQGWFASFSAFSKHVKLSFVCDSYLDPGRPAGRVRTDRRWTWRRRTHWTRSRSLPGCDKPPTTREWAGEARAEWRTTR